MQYHKAREPNVETNSAGGESKLETRTHRPAGRTQRTGSPPVRSAHRATKRLPSLLLGCAEEHTSSSFTSFTSFFGLTAPGLLLWRNGVHGVTVSYRSQAPFQVLQMLLLLLLVVVIIRIL